MILHAGLAGACDCHVHIDGAGYPLAPYGNVEARAAPLRYDNESALARARAFWHARSLGAQRTQARLA